MRKNLFYSIIFSLTISISAQQFTELGSDDLYLSLDGSWKFDLSTFATGNVSSALENLYFTQIPNLDATIWLFNKYFFETKIREISEENIFLLGYQNDVGLIEEIRIGNDDLNIANYAGFTPSININRSPGSRVKITSSNSEHEILARYTSEINNSVHYIGYNSVEKETKLINKYLKNRAFVLPFNDFQDLKVFTQSDGDLNLLSNQNYIFYPNSNIIYFEEIENDLILIFLGDINKDDYEDILINYINPMDNPNTKYSTDELWNKYVVNIGGDNYLKLNTYYNSPFDHLGCYSLETITDIENQKLEIFINDTKLINHTTIDDIILFHNISLPYNQLKNRYPFIEFDSDIYNPEGHGLNSEYELNFLSLTPVTKIIVPTEAKKNSLNVIINGISYKEFNHNSETGEVTFEKSISPFDDIVINYKTEITTGTGNLLLSYGSRYFLRDNLTIDFSHTASWDFSSSDYSIEAGENSGSLISRGLINYESEIVSVELKAALMVSTPDTLNKYQLFQYEQSQIKIPISGIILDKIPNDGVPLIKRINNDLNLTFDEISTLPVDAQGGAYVVKSLDNKISSNTIVLETQNLDVDEFSSVNINLDIYADDYSWATGFFVELLNSGNQKEIEFKFINSKDLTEESLTKTILETTSNFNKYEFIFSQSERAQLTNIDSIEVKLFEGNETIILIKDINFIGDSLVTHNNSTNFHVSETNSNMKIKPTSEASIGENIEISSKISPININKYKKLSFTLNNLGLITNSIIKFQLYNNGTTVGFLNIPTGLIIGENIIIIDTETNSVIINGITRTTANWESSDIESDSFTFNIDNCGEGSVIVSEIVLSEPIWEYNNQNSLKIKFKPDLSMKIDKFPLIDNIEFISENTIIDRENIKYSGKNSLNLDLMGTNISTILYYAETLERLEYKIKFPSWDFPIKLTDHFSYDENRFRSNKLDINTDLMTLNLELSDSLTKENGYRKTTFNTTIGHNAPLFFSSSNEFNQNRDDEITTINTELFDSYKELLPKDSLDIQNSLSQSFELNYKDKNFDCNNKIYGKLKLSLVPEKIDTNEYGLSSESNISLFSFTISPLLSTYYSYTNKISDTDSISSGILNYMELFSETNPYQTINIEDIFYSNKNDNYYIYNNSDSNRILNSLVSLKLEHNYLLSYGINIFIPKTIKISLSKNFKQDESLEKTTLLGSLESSFTNNPEIKNSFNFTRSLNIENNGIENTFIWDFMLYKELSNTILVNATNNFSFTNNEKTNLTKIKIQWLGKSGPLLVIPLIDKVLDSPYNYKHSEITYLNLNDDLMNFKIGFRHETILTVIDMNETNFYIDIIYDDISANKLNIELGLFTTLIF